MDEQVFRKAEQGSLRARIHLWFRLLVRHRCAVLVVSGNEWMRDQPSITAGSKAGFDALQGRGAVSVEPLGKRSITARVSCRFKAEVKNAVSS